ncbi:GNAT family N-acetyltransferase [Halapricum sp. CBA1109]|uniref:GNAT family N-acetyltransferase n=1 Tax=Halapricum sp. CBA1109 TaxID=2668068 RepID=UPI00351BD788
MLFPETVETDRLRLERLCHATVDVFEHYRQFSTEARAIDEVMRYLPREPMETPHDAEALLDRRERQWVEGERAEYVIRPKSGEDGAGEVAGTGGLIVDWETATGKPAICLRKRFWGRGYSGERAAAMIEMAFDRLDLGLVAVPIEDGNDRSRRAVEEYVERFGGQYDGVVRNATRRPDGRVVDRHRYTITREQYREATDGT